MQMISRHDRYDRYDRTTRALHWLQAVLILGLVLLGWWVTGLSYYHSWYNDSLFWHRVLGLLVPLVAIGQLARRRWRVSLPPVGVRWERCTATVMHGLFFWLMWLIPISGYLISTSSGAAIPLPGGMEMPALVAVGERVREVAVSAHYWLAYGIAVLAAGHAAAACKHQFIDRDSVLRRML